MTKHRFNWEYKEGYSTQNILGDKPLMSEGETECILKYLKPHMTMFEYGAGGSTLFFPRYVRRYYSVENQAHWYKFIKNKIKDNPEFDNVDIYFVQQDIASDYNDYPVDDEFHTYAKSISNIGIDKFDIILVDGPNRSRAFCADVAYNHMDNDSILCYHDYYSHLYEKKYMFPEGWNVEDKYEIIDKVELSEENPQSIAIMRKRI